MHTTFRHRLAAACVGIALCAGAAAASPRYAADGARSQAYRDGQKALAEERWSDALAAFTAIADAKTGEADAALYWKAWTESKLGRRAEALASLRRLAADHPKSEWLDDAQVLELELKGPRAASGGAGRTEADDDLKLYALDGLMQVEPERAVPILERFLAGEHSLKLKERALFVLAQSDTPRARQILIELVRSGSPPELRLKAVEQLGVAGSKDDLRALGEIWKDATPEVKSKVLEAWMVAGDAAPVVQVARTEQDERLRRKAIEMLGVMNATEELGRLYASETEPAVRARLLEAYGVAGDVGALSRAARGEKDVELRRKAIEGLGVFGGAEGSRELVALYGVESDRALRRKIAEALMVNGDAEALITLFRQEKDPEMKRAILQQLSVMDDESVEQLLTELLEGQR